MINKIISYSLWGKNEKYIKGAEKNIELAKIYFPDWKVRIYLSNNTEFHYTSDNLEIIHMNESQSYDGAFWRFIPCEYGDIVIIRDLDDRLSHRHKYVVDEWLSSNKDIHIIRDHPNHLSPVMAGLWGCRSGVLNGIISSMKLWRDKSYYGCDQDFLKDYIWRYDLIDKIFIHDEFHKNIGIEQDINLRRADFEFMGDTYDENDVRTSQYYNVIKNYYKTKK